MGDRLTRIYPLSQQDSIRAPVHPIAKQRSLFLHSRAHASFNFPYNQLAYPGTKRVQICRISHGWRVDKLNSIHYTNDTLSIWPRGAGNCPATLPFNSDLSTALTYSCVAALVAIHLYWPCHPTSLPSSFILETITIPSQFKLLLTRKLLYPTDFTPHLLDSTHSHELLLARR